MLSWLEDTPISQWVAQSDLGYPILLSIHSMGMATVVGLLILLDLRVLGFAKAIPLAAFEKLMPLAWIGFFFNLCSGALLFSATATHMIGNWPFLSKMASIALGGAVSWALWRNLRPGEAEPAANSEAAASLIVTPAARGLAIVSIAVWLTAIFFGRLIAYVLDAAMLAG